MQSVALTRRAALFGAFGAALFGTLGAAAPQADAHTDVYVRIGPPALRYEPVPPPPVGPHRWVWVPGYWTWNGARYVWYRGRYVQRAHGAWRPGRWEHRPGGWIWVGGRWY